MNLKNKDTLEDDLLSILDKHKPKNKDDEDFIKILPKLVLFGTFHLKSLNHT